MRKILYSAVYLKCVLYTIFDKSLDNEWWTFKLKNGKDTVSGLFCNIAKCVLLIIYVWILDVIHKNVGRKIQNFGGIHEIQK